MKDELKKRGRPKKEEALIKAAHPETMRIMIAKAHGIARNITCPECGAKFDVKVGDKADRELLMHLDNRVQGKPVAKTEVDMNATMELSSGQLLRLAESLKEYMKMREAETIESVEAEFKAIKEPELPELTSPETIQQVSQPVKEIRTEKKELVNNSIIVEDAGQYAMK